ncbi:unnamed protein product [Cuscuta europaea]|uniref:Uncharacterized protein n=1 Tax=Cuscuta europaea TaxID=41803 RepID=A0A9P1EIQ3_CUSEU|nr:unnamed protein product [Cuscuta europaea]
MEGEDGEQNVLKTKRNVMPAPALKSPFVNRVTEIKAPPTTEEIKVAQFVFKEGTDKKEC